MNEEHDPNQTADIASVPADSFDAGLTAGLATPADPLCTTDHVASSATTEGFRPTATLEADAPAIDLPAVSGYRVLREIARGGMGRVLAAHDLTLDREVALKVLLPGANADRFVRESKITARLPHPGIPPVHALGTLADGSPFLAMKLIAGQTLAVELTTADRPRLLQAFAQVCQAVGFAHSRGIIHRDLKPANVMVGAFGEVQVMDWGLAKDKEVTRRQGDKETRRKTEEKDSVSLSPCLLFPLSSDDGGRTQAGTVLGTPAYMAPEQARGEVVDARADVFALGGILCVILTGQPPFHGTSALEVIRRAGAGDLVEAFARLDGCGADAEVVALCRRCLSPSPVDRPADGQVVADRLTAYLNGVQVRLQAAELARVEERARRRLTVAVAASLLGLIILCGGGWAYLQSVHASRRAVTERVVNKSLEEATLWWGQARTAEVGDLSPWSAALNAARKAEELLAAGEAGPQLQDRVGTVLAGIQQGQADAQAKDRELRRDRDLLDRLAKIRSGRSVHFKASQTDAEYAAAFRDFGIDFELLDPKEAGMRLASRSAPVELAAFLDDWVYVRAIIPPNQERAFWRRLNEAARAADPDPWRDALRAQIRGTDRNALSRLADDQKALESQPAISLLLLARWLQDLGDRVRTEAILLQAWRRQPNDFWVNDQLGWLYLWGTRLWSQETKPAEAARYYSVAVSIRPQSFVAHMNLGVALCPIRLDQGVAELREATRLEPSSAAAHINLAIGLNEQSKFAEMAAEYREAIRYEPQSALAHEGLALGLYRLGKPAEAIAAMREVLRLEPDGPNAHNNLAFMLAVPPTCPPGDYDEALVHARRAVQLNPGGSTFGTLALAEYRAGHWAESLAAGERSLALEKNAESDLWFTLALASWRKGEKDKARMFFDKGADWAMKHARRIFAGERQLWSEAANLLGLPSQSVP